MAEADRRSLFADAFREHRGRVYRYLKRRLGNEADAQELSQETYLRLLRAPRAELIKDPQAYLYRVARNLLYEQHGRALPPQSWVDEIELETLEDSATAPDAAAEEAHRFELMEQSLSELPPRCRAVVLLFCREGLSQREIGERIGLSKSMVQKYLATGVAHCRKRLKRFREPGVR